jgi:hypothetical protein
VRTTLASLFAITVGLAACGGDDGGYNPPGDDDDDDEPDAMRPDADPNAIDAAVGPDALGDGASPLITVVSPEAGTIVSGIMTLSVDVVDDDGVDVVSATIAGVHEIDMAREDLTSERWVGVYDTFPLSGLVAPTIVIRAIDASGATAEKGFEIVLDNASPVASLDPADVRLVQPGTAGFECSRPFDPVGEDAPSDGQSVPQLSEMRARVADLPNSGTLATTLYIPMGGVATVDLYVLDDSTRPLVVDTDGDGTCDAINPDIVPATTPVLSNEAAVVSLEGVDGGGTGDFRDTIFGGENANTCDAGTDTDAPAGLCFGELATSAAIDTAFTNEPQIFGIPQVDELNCLGFAFDARASNISDGWACAAVLTVDTLGNRGVSAPLRICVDSNGDETECLPWGEIAAEGVRPSCTGTVTGGVVNNTPCVPADFTGVTDDFELIFP